MSYRLKLLYSTLIVLIAAWNIPNALGWRIRCRSCSSATDGKACFESPNNLGTCETKSGYCYTNVVEDKDIIRGCIGDSIIPDTNNCSRYDHCTFCSLLDDCNRNVVRREKCYVGPYNKTHPFNLTESQSIECPLSAFPRGCFDKGNFMNQPKKTKGCVSSLNRAQMQPIETFKYLFKVCHGDGCNNATGAPRQCYACNSKMDADCLQPNESTQMESCRSFDWLSQRELSRFSPGPIPIQSCIVGIDEDGHTHRKCAAETSINSLNFTNSFKTCKWDSCNGDVYPENRLKCIQCEKDENCNAISPEDHETWKSSIGICKNYSENDECYSFIDTSNDQVIRGCMSDNSTYSIACKDVPGNCSRCKSEGCNSHEKSTIITITPNHGRSNSFDFSIVIVPTMIGLLFQLIF